MTHQVLIVAHRRTSPTGAMRHDQFVLRGGKLLGLLDANVSSTAIKVSRTIARGHDAGRRFFAAETVAGVGYRIQSTKVVADKGYTREISFQEGQPPRPMPTFLFVNPDGINKQDVVTSQIDNLLSPGRLILGQPATGLNKQCCCTRQRNRSWSMA